MICGTQNLKIPDDLKRVLQADTNITWILLKNQASVWPIQIVGNKFGIGWEQFCIENHLISGYQVILASETKCIFEVLIFNKECIGVFNMYSNENALPAPLYLFPGKFSLTFPLRHFKFVYQHLSLSSFLSHNCNSGA